MKKILSCLLLVCSGLLLKAQEIPTMETYTLKNGLKIYLLKYGKIEAMHVSLVINSGKKNEIPGQQGYNGMVAEMVLKGNEKFSEEAQNDKAFALGCELTSNPGWDYTSITSDFLSKDADAVFDLMSAAVLKPTFDKEKTEQMISSLVSYNTPAKMDISALVNIYSNLSVHGIENPLGRSIYKQQLKLVTPEKLKEFHRFNYTPKNTRIIVCGNFNTADIKSMVETYFGSWQSQYGEVNGVSLDEPVIKKKDLCFVNRMGASQCALRWTKQAPSVTAKDALAFRIANMIFNEVLFREIREKGGKTYSIVSSYNHSTFSNLFTVGCSVRSEEMLNTMNLFDKTLEDFSTGSFTQQEFDNEITRFKTDMLNNEYPEEIANFYNPLIYDFNTRKNIINDLNKLTVEDIKKVIKKYYTPGIYKLVLSGDEELVKQQLEKIKELKKLTAANLEYNPQ